MGDETFFLTYGDGVSDINLNELKNFHSKNDSIITMTSAQPEGRFGSLFIIINDKVTSFKEKPKEKGDGSMLDSLYVIRKFLISLMKTPNNI